MILGNQIIRLEIVISIVIFLFIVKAHANVGLTSHYYLDETLLRGIRPVAPTSDLAKICKLAGVNGRHNRSCGRNKEVAAILVEAALNGISQCQILFKYERWNCSVGATRLRILKKAFRETAVLFAISGAALTYETSRACATGRFSRCSCDVTMGTKSQVTHAWKWGGCGDNVQFGMKFAKRFFIGHKKSRRISRQNQDIKTRIDFHNFEVGIRAVHDSVGKHCKCHGLSGSCTTQICWYKMNEFEATTSQLKRRYDSAKMTSLKNRLAEDTGTGTGTVKGLRKFSMSAKKEKRQKKSERTKEKKYSVELKKEKREGEKDFLFLDPSPNFCRLSDYGVGTCGRYCVKNISCDTLCCGRGYDSLMGCSQEPCQCQLRLDASEGSYIFACNNCTSCRERHMCKENISGCH